MKRVQIVSSGAWLAMATTFGSTRSNQGKNHSVDSANSRCMSIAMCSAERSRGKPDTARASRPTEHRQPRPNQRTRLSATDTVEGMESCLQVVDLVADEGRLGRVCPIAGQ